MFQLDDAIGSSVARFLDEVSSKNFFSLFKQQQGKKDLKFTSFLQKNISYWKWKLGWVPIEIGEGTPTVEYRIYILFDDVRIRSRDRLAEQR